MCSALSVSEPHAAVRSALVDGSGRAAGGSRTSVRSQWPQRTRPEWPTAARAEHGHSGRQLHEQLALATEAHRKAHSSLGSLFDEPRVTLFVRETPLTGCRLSQVKSPSAVRRLMGWRVICIRALQIICSAHHIASIDRLEAVRWRLKRCVGDRTDGLDWRTCRDGESTRPRKAGLQVKCL